MPPSTREHYSISLNGEAELARLLNVGKALGVGTPGVGLAGPAQMDLEVAGTWVGFAPPVPSGKIQLRAATAELQGVSEPLHIASATATLANQAVNVTAFTATFAQGPEISGSASFPVHCTAPETCIVHFDAHTDDVSLSRLNRLVNPGFRTQPWYRLLAPWQRREDALLKLRASGHFTAARMEMGSAVANNVSGTAELERRQAARQRFPRRPPRRTSHRNLDGRLHGVAAEVCRLGKRYASVDGAACIPYARQLGDRHARCQVQPRHGRLDSCRLCGTRPAAPPSSPGSGGSLRHVTLDPGVLRVSFSDFAGIVSLQNGTLNLTDCKLQSAGGNYAVKGTASFDRNLDLRFERTGGRTYAISGPLEKPRVEAVPAPPSAEAALPSAQADRNLGRLRAL